MKRVLLTGAAVLMSLSSAAFADNTPTRGGNAAVNPPAATMPSTVTTGSSGLFATVPANEQLSSKVVGLEIYNNANQSIGKIKDVAFDQSGVKAYIVSVGGVMGMGDRYVAVKPSAVTMSHDANNKKWSAAMNTNAEQLKAAPEYKYSSND